MSAGRRTARPSRRGADKALGDELRRRGDGRWLYNGAEWLSVADIRVKVCGTDAKGRDIPEAVPGWLDIGPLTAAELAARLEPPFALPEPVRAPSRARAERKAPEPATYAGAIQALADLVDTCATADEAAALLAAADALVLALEHRDAAAAVAA